MRKKVFAILLIVLLLFIWGNSCLPKQVSAQASGWVTELLRPIFQAVFGEEAVTEHFVRKLAHFSEYAALGCVIVLLLFCIPIRSGWRVLYGAMGAMMVALLDETIQIFSGRGPMIQDVWLDFSGAVFGGSVTFLLYYLIKGKKRST